jgi:short-subunit dehydrogenase
MSAIKNIVITGASKGLGRELAIKLSQSNHNLILAARSKEALECLQKEIHTHTGKVPLIVSCDVSNESSVRNLAEIIRKKYQHIDVLVNNAGIGIHKSLIDMSCEEIRRQFEINCFGVFYCIKTLLPVLKASPSAYIINIGSLLSRVSFAETSIYSATKFALYGFTEGFRNEMKKYKIKTGFFLPGKINTAFHDNKEGTSLKSPELLTIDPGMAAAVIEKMINKRKTKVYMYRWMLWLMKIKQFYETLN